MPTCLDEIASSKDSSRSSSRLLSQRFWSGGGWGCCPLPAR